MGVEVSDFNFTIDLPVRSEWSDVDLLRQSVQNCFSVVFRDLEGCQTLSMVTGELLENAVKYGNWSASESGFRLRVWGEEHVARVSVQSPTRPDDPGAKELLRRLAWIKAFPSAESAYKARLLEVAAANDGGASSGLGLVRIAYEGNCRLDATIQDGVLSVVATMPL